jgi:tRNA threonylcarbamoyladenosine biosynthesis protein TsaB
MKRNPIVLLAMDTATTTASLAVYNLAADRLMAEITWQAKRRQTEQLLTTTTDLLATLDLQPADLTALAVTTGPGSFTGVRIGISTIKGIGIGLPMPPRIVGIPTLSVAAAPWIEAAAATGAQVYALIQAGRGRYNWCAFGDGDLLMRPDVAQHHTGRVDDLAASLAAAPQPVWLVGELANEVTVAATAMDHVHVIDPVSGLRRTGQLARLAALSLAAGVEDKLHDLQPLYLRNP